MSEYNIQDHLALIDEFRKTPKPWWTEHEVIFPTEGQKMTAIIEGAEYTAYCPPKDQLPCVVGFGSPDKIVLALSCFCWYGKPCVADRAAQEGGNLWQPRDLGKIEVCPISGEIISYNWRDGIKKEIITQAKVGFGVAACIDKIVRYKNYPYWFIIDGDSYACRESGIVKTGHQPRSSDSVRGFGGRTFRIKKGDQIYTIDDLWHGGSIPAWMRDRFPDNAEFVKDGINGQQPT